MDYSAALERYRPSGRETEKLRKLSGKAEAFVNGYCRENDIRADAVLVGSVAKGTNLKGADLDLFIRFDKRYSRKEMERLGLDMGHRFLSNGMEKYAEHPYVTGTVEDVKLDIVPCYRIMPGQKKVSSVDRTPLHTEYVKSSVTEKMLDDVLLLKIFAKSIGVYGSEVITSGFSGYICEVLTISLGSFENVLRSFSRSKGRYFLGKKENVVKFREPVVIIDPVDDDRNAAAAISMESLSKMKMASRMFLKTRSDDFFEIQRKPGRFSREDRGTVLRIFSIPRPDLTDDVIYPQAVRFRNSLWSVLEREGFEPLDSEVEVTDKVRVLIECRNSSTPAFILHQGPPVDSENSIDFLRKWEKEDVLRGPYIREDRVYVDLKGDRKKLEDVVADNIGSLNIGRNLNEFKPSLIITKADPSTEESVMRKFLSRGLF